VKIACLGWGSLVWDPRDLLIRRKWFSDGPLLPIEFCRQSDDGRITLVIAPQKPRVRTLWAIFSTEVLDDAVESLRAREGICKKNVSKDVGRWVREQGNHDSVDPDIHNWASWKGLDAVLWTSLTPKFLGEIDRVPSAEAVLDYLRNLLPYERRRHAEQYIRRTPVQIDTDYRRLIEMQLGWLPYEE